MTDDDAPVSTSAMFVVIRKLMETYPDMTIGEALKKFRADNRMSNEEIRNILEKRD